MRIAFCTLVVWAALVAVCTPAAGAAGAYVALGDSVAAPPGSYVHLLFAFLRTPEGGALDTLHNRARGGETSTTLRTGGQLASAIADIDQPSDTKFVTIDIGGNDRVSCGGPSPTWHLTTCAFAANFDATLADLQAALERDPGPESLVAMTYYNPAGGTGSVQEQDYDRGLLGTDLQLYCTPDGDARLGLNDRIACIARSRGAAVADVYPAFKTGGQALMSDGIHPNADGQAVIAHEFGKALGLSGPVPPGPDNTPPVLVLAGPTPQNILHRRAVLVVAGCRTEACTVSAKGSVTIRGAPRVYELRPVAKRVAAGRRARLKLTLTRRALRAVRRAVRRGGRARAKVIIKAADAAGNVTTKRRTVRFRVGLRRSQPGRHRRGTIRSSAAPGPHVPAA